MSKEVASARIQHRGMSTQEWESSSDILMEREIGIDMTTGYPKVGDGKSRFSELKDLRGERGDKGDSITITKQLRVSDGVQITFSDETQVTIPKGEKGDSVKGDRGNSVESARLDESGNFYVTIEGQSEKLLGNLKGSKGDKGDALKFEDLTPDQIAQIKAKDVDLSAYVTKAELKTVGAPDVKAINDFLGLSQKVFTSNYSYSDSLLKSYSSPSYSASWYVNESTKDVNVKDKVLITISNTTTRVDNYLEVSVTYVGSNYVTATSTGRLLTTPGEVKVLTKEQIAATYAKKEHKHEIDDINGLQGTLNRKADAIHYHRIDDIAGLQQAFNDRPTIERISQALATALEDVVRQGQLSGYVRSAEIQHQFNNIGKLKDTKTGQFLDVMVVDKGQVPRDTTGMIVFERSGGK